VLIEIRIQIVMLVNSFILKPELDSWSKLHIEKRNITKWRNNSDESIVHDITKQVRT